VVGVVADRDVRSGAGLSGGPGWAMADPWRVMDAGRVQ
jgi:hypothetical protein